MHIAKGPPKVGMSQACPPTVQESTLPLPHLSLLNSQSQYFSVTLILLFAADGDMSLCIH